MHRPALLCMLLVVACRAQPDAPVAIEAVTLLGTVDLSVGTLDGAPETSFGRVSGVAEDALGRIFVADFTAHQVRVFSSTGAFLFSIGRKGGGPGELNGPCCLSFAPDGSLWVRDGGNARYVGFHVSDGSGEAVATLNMSHPDVWYSAALGFASDSSRIDVGSRPSPSGNAELVRFFVRDGEGVSRMEVVPQPAPEELGTVVKGEGFRRLFFPQPYGARFLTAFGPDGSWATAMSSRPTVESHPPLADGWSVAQDLLETPVLSSEEVAYAESTLDSYQRLGGGPRSDYPSVPDRKPPLASLMFDRDGLLWVASNTPESQPAHADVYDREGQLVGARSWPRDVDLAFPAWIGRDHALGISTDSLGVQRVVRVRFGSK